MSLTEVYCVKISIFCENTNHDWTNFPLLFPRFHNFNTIEVKWRPQLNYYHFRIDVDQPTVYVLLPF